MGKLILFLAVIGLVLLPLAMAGDGLQVRQEYYFLDVKCVDKLSGDQARARTEFTVDFP